jgi:voltage-gated potassium channel
MIKNNKKSDNDLKQKLHEIIFGFNTFPAKFFDIVLAILIILSTTTIILESVVSLRIQFKSFFMFAEIFFITLFTIEYLLRIYVSRKRLKYITSFYGIIDLIAILPAIIGLFIVGFKALLVIRVFRLLRIFRILKLVHFVTAEKVLLNGLKKSIPKIIVFIMAVFSIVIVTGTIMYLVEGNENGFVNIPQSMYWAVVTITTVGFGDIVPRTVLGKIISAFLMVVGYGIIAVPTGIVSFEFAKAGFEKSKKRFCNNCSKQIDYSDAEFCKHCGSKMN